MKTTYKSSLLALVSASSFLAASATSAPAAGISLTKAVGQAVLHKVASSHELPFLSSPLNANKLMVILPEPNSGVLFAAGGLIVLAFVWLRRRSASKATASARQ